MKSEVQNELLDLNAHFLSMNKSSEDSYRVPQNYFEESQLELELIALKENNYQIPSNYFSNLEEQLMNKVEKSTINSNRPVRRFMIAGPLITVAASLIIVLATFILFNQFSKNQQSSWSEQQIELLYSEFEPEEIDWIVSPTSYVFDGIEDELFVIEPSNQELLDPIFEPLLDEQIELDSLLLSI